MPYLQNVNYFPRLEKMGEGARGSADGQGAQQHVILRSNVITISGSTNSLMPNELERGLSEQDLADLLAYLKRGSVAR